MKEQDINYKSQYSKLVRRIPYDEYIHGDNNNYKIIIEDLLEATKYVALSHIYPFEDFYEYELPKKYLNWQIRACVELYNLGDKSTIINYSENGLSWSRLTDGLSSSLLGELMPKVGIPKPKEVEETPNDTENNDSEQEEEKDNV